MPNAQLDDRDLFPRSNRNPTPASEAMIKQLLAKEEESLAHLDKFIGECNETLDLARKNIASSKERMRKAKMRQAVAVQLRDALRNGLESIQGVDIVGEEINSGTQITKKMDEDEDTISYTRGLQNLLQSRETTILDISKQIEDTESLIAQQAETLAIAYEEFQSSLFVQQITQETLDSTASQCLQAVASIQSKKGAIRPIFRLPREILNQIFRETTYQPLRKAEYINWHRVPKTWRQPFILSAVCYQWRSVCRADPRLWKDPVIIIQNDDHPSKSHFQTHCTLTAGTFDTLTIVAQGAPEFLYSHSLREQFSHIKALNVLIIDAYDSDGRTILTSDWWHPLPAIKEILIFDLYGSSDDLTVALPSSFATSLRKIRCTNTLLTFDSPMSALEELSIELQDDHYFPSLIAEIRRSGTNLRKLHFAGYLDHDEGDLTADSRTPLANLREISMSCQNLLEYFVPYFMCPYLRKISLLVSAMPVVMDWDPFFAQGNLATTIEEVDIFSMHWGEVQNISFLDKLKNLNTLTLQGESVEPILQARIDIMAGVPDQGYSLLCFSTLETLKIKSYEESGEVVLQYVEALQGLQLNDANQDSVQDRLKRVVFQDCPCITHDVKSRIAVLYPDH